MWLIMVSLQKAKLVSGSMAQQSNKTKLSASYKWDLISKACSVGNVGILVADRRRLKLNKIHTVRTHPIRQEIFSARVWLGHKLSLVCAQCSRAREARGGKRGVGGWTRELRGGRSHSNCYLTLPPKAHAPVAKHELSTCQLREGTSRALAKYCICILDVQQAARE